MGKEEITLSKTSLTLIYATYKVNLSLLKTSYSLVTILFQKLLTFFLKSENIE